MKVIKIIIDIILDKLNLKILIIVKYLLKNRK